MSVDTDVLVVLPSVYVRVVAVNVGSCPLHFFFFLYITVSVGSPTV